MLSVKNLLRRFIAGMEPWVFLPAAAIVVVFAGLAATYTDSARVAFDMLQTGIVETFGWFYILVATLLLIFVTWLMFSRFGKIRLGSPGSRPEFDYPSWVAMLLSAGMGIGIVFFGAAEPLQHYLDPPDGEPESSEAMREGMRITFFHWGPHPWAIYSAFALPIAYYHFRHGLPLAPRSLLYPVFGEGIYGPVGHFVDVLATVGTLFGVATSLGLGAQQVNAGLNQLFGLPTGTGPQLALIAGITMAAIVSVVSGLHRGIRFLSVANVALAAILLIFVMLAGPTIFVAELFLDGLGYFIQQLPYSSLHIQPGAQEGWQARWTLFYWSWWISWSPFVGIFVARISRGRTIREFVVTTLIVPTLGTFLWFSVMGGTAIRQVMNGRRQLAELAGDSPEIVLLRLVDVLPLQELLWVLVTLIVIVFFVTSSDSGSFVDDMVTSGGHPNPPRAQRVFWALAEGLVAGVLLYAGGLNALRTASLTTGIPIAIFLLVAAYGLIRSLRFDARHQSLPGLESRSDLD
ncbi:MAG: BCCT family transporter [Alphaproteobacteria bacterium]|jgi:choline/glycine/proline betaine transport protein|nr:BCCT family transporter [Alphaproteobacteria bacterium]